MDNFPSIIKKCRSKETSSDPEHRSQDNSSYRQCLATALLASDFLWFSVYAEKITIDADRTGYHYFNKDMQNIPLNFCEEQFAHENITARKDERLLDKNRIDVILKFHPEIKQQYEILKQRFEEEIAILFK